MDVVEGEAEVSCHACFGYEGCLGEEVWVWVDAAFNTSSAFCLRMKRAEPSRDLDQNSIARADHHALGDSQVQSSPVRPSPATPR